MKQEQIPYDQIIALGFTEKKLNDSVYFNEYGFDYTLVTKRLTKKIYIEWAKEKRTCKIVRIDNRRECNIKGQLPIMNLAQLKSIINFFTD